MEEEKKENTTLPAPPNNINNLLDEKVKQTNDVKTAIDILATQTALKQEETLEKVVTEKQEELRNDAEAKRIQAETDRISKEVEKVKQEKEKELAELDKEISAKEKEVEKLKADSDKAQAFFDSNEDILSCIGIRSKKTLKVMYALMIPATIIFILIRFIALPLTIGGKLVEILIEIIGGICKAITNSALKIIISIFVILLLTGGGFCAYYFGGQLIL
jgi:flagellar motility protein MotE (MotC chaperone)